MKQPAGIVAPAPLSPKEEAELSRAERAIEQAERGFYDFGRGLAAIHAGKLYRPKTWERYCLERWELSHDQANRLMDAAELVDALKKHANWRENLPAREAHVRPLFALGASDRPAAWSRAVALAGKRRVQARDVERAVEEILGKPIDAGPGEVDASVMEAFNALPAEMKREAIQRAEDEASGRPARASNSPRAPRDTPDVIGSEEQAIRKWIENVVLARVQRPGGDVAENLEWCVMRMLAVLDGWRPPQEWRKAA